MKKPIIFSVLFFIITAISSFGQGEWIEEEYSIVEISFGAEVLKKQFKIGKLRIHGKIYEIKPSVNLEGANLEGANLEGVNLSRANLDNANLKGANINKANLEITRLRAANLYEANLTESNLYGTKFNNAILTKADLSKAYSNSKIFFRNADLKEAILVGLYGNSVSFIDACLDGANLSHASLSGADFNRTSIKSADLYKAYLWGALFKQANLTSSNLSFTDLTQSLWTDCNLTGAVLIGSNYEDITILGEETNTGNSFVAVTLDQLSIINSIPDKVTITPDQSNAILANTTRSQNNESRLNNNIGELIEGDRFNLSKIRENTTAIEQQAIEIIANSTRSKQNQFDIENSLGELVEGDRFNLSRIRENTTAIEQQAIEIIANSTRSKQNQFDIENSLGELVEGDRFNLSRIRENTSKIENHDTIINSMRDETETMKAQLQTLVASVAEKDAKIVELEKRPTVEQLATLEAEKDAISQDIVALYEDFRNTRDELDELKKEKNALDENVATLTSQRDEAIAERDERPTPEQIRDARAGSVVLTVDPEGGNITLGLTIEQSDNLIEWTKLDGEMTRTIPIPDGKKFYRFALEK